MPPEAEVLLTAITDKNARIGQHIEERLSLRRYRKGVCSLQVLVILVCGFDELRVSLPHVLMGMAADYTSAAAEIEACCAIAKGQQGRRGLRITGLHQDAPSRGFGGWCGNADLRPLDGEGLVPQSRIRLTAALVRTRLGGIRGTAEEPSKQVTHRLVRLKSCADGRLTTGVQPNPLMRTHSHGV